MNKMTLEQAIKDIEHQLNYVQNRLRKDVNEESQRFCDGMEEAYKIALGIMKGEEL